MTPPLDTLLQLIVAELALLAAIGLRIAWRLARQPTLVPGPQAEDPHLAFRRLVCQATGRAVGDLTPLRGSANPPYLLFLEDATGRRLLLVGDGRLKAALAAERLPRRRYPTHRVTRPEEIGAAWAALAPRLKLPALPPAVKRWQVVELPPEELA